MDSEFLLFNITAVVIRSILRGRCDENVSTQYCS